MAYDWQIVNSILNDSEKNRFLCCVINSDQGAFNSIVNWEKATSDFGSASVESMRKCLSNTLKKIEHAGGKIGVSASDGAVNKTPGSSSTGKKRKTAAEADPDGKSDSGTPTPKAKRGRPKKEPAAESRKGIMPRIFIC
jgi:hypothetical protein